ncbi:23S rRNA (adenine(2503)-C(2))-methyltransferase RlmN [Candidatus Beckwithbacteria bacterium CG23_combo_of_CG06-09_8_20_14_all_34_8]|uniref:23S rRNA (Adenine(2503)-C(2))-methyltransferase RlmN n=1 Tax=Candidatus Beckwithbacteria bacterium CG23_combo_of_CG06-09_8_20_14_all_34_8 TaxID=1974497 RepID=A0A2H0B6Z5_9BACT|nr:MAG: 23S rRNA (adenine(2503)-C(2))-methyltransferase RlmN [Candidatus Beckwithbacteria bacterium CG23_combo_of_CG06-09_8_20_14_all_34_8]
MDFNRLKLLLIENGEPQYRFSQIVSEVCSGKIDSFEQLFTIPQILRNKLSSSISLISLTKHTVNISSTKKAYKALLKLKDGNLIETVLLNPTPNLWSVCLSCQAGCAMGCAFCATGQQGLKRNLTSEEICDQILFWKQYINQNKLKIRISNVVYMGMGEPLLNQENVFESIRWLIDENLYVLGQRHISVSTCGIIPGIEAFTKQNWQVNLAISLHASNDKLRTQLMPIAKQYSLSQLLDCIKTYLVKTNRQIFIEYIMLYKVNDMDSCALELGNLCKQNFSNLMHLVHVNLIPYNSTGGEFVSSDAKQMGRFSSILNQFHINSTIRQSLGQDIFGACGQLKGKIVKDLNQF